MKMIFWIRNEGFRPSSNYNSVIPIPRKLGPFIKHDIVIPRLTWFGFC